MARCSACGLNVTVALAAGAALGAGAGEAAGAGTTAGGTADLAAVDAVPDDGRLMLRLGVIMRAVLPREAFSRQTSLGRRVESDRPISAGFRAHSRPSPARRERRRRRIAPGWHPC